MRLLIRLLLFVPLMSACDPPTPPSAPTFEASSAGNAGRWPRPARRCVDSIV